MFNLKKSVFLFIILINIILFASPIFPVYAACPTGKTAVVGDSLAVADGGIGGKLKSACPNSQIDVFAHGGDETVAIKKQFNTNVINGGYNNVIIEGGYNDINGAKTPEQIEKNLSDMYNAAKEKKMYIIAINIPTDQNGTDKWGYYNGKRIEVSPETKRERTNTVNSWIPSQGVNYVINAYSTWGNPKDVHDASKYNQVIKEITNSIPFTGETVTPPITPTSTEVKVTCSGKPQVVSEQSEEPDELVKEPVSSSNFEETTFTTTETDQARIQEEAKKKCDDICAQKNWTECSAQITSPAPPEVVSGPTVKPYTVDAEKWGGSTLISGDTACEIWKNAFYLGISFLGVLALCGVIWGGFSYMTSYGNQERITSAKASIWGSIAGMLIGLFAYLLFTLINPYVLECKIEAPFKLSVSSYSPGTVPGGDGQGDTGKNIVPDSSFTPTGIIKDCENKFVQKGKYDAAIEEAAKTHNLDPHFQKAIIQIESGYGSNIGPSPTGAYGISQFQPSTFKDFAPSGTPASCKKKSTTNTAVGGQDGGYCGNSFKKDGSQTNPNCCQIKPKYTKCEVYAPDCMTWIKDNPNEMINVSATYLSQLRSTFNNDYYAAAAAYERGEQGYKDYIKETGSKRTDYADKAEKHDKTFCKQSKQ